MSITRIGIIGCGKQAEKHTRSLQKLADAEIIVADIDSSRALHFAEKMQVKWVEQTELLYEDSSVKAVVICTPTSSHVPLISKAVAANKAIFCEKPLSDSLASARELQHTTRGYTRPIMIGYIYRFAPVFEKGFNIIRHPYQNRQNTALGRPISAMFRIGGRGSHQQWKHRKETAGGVINELLVHMVDLANWYFGELNDFEVLSCGLKFPNRLINDQMVSVDAEDFIMLRCTGEQGTEIYFHADFYTPAFCQYVEIQGENGSFMGSIQPEMPSYIFLKRSRDNYPAGKKINLHNGSTNANDAQLKIFYQAVIGTHAITRNSIEDSVVLMHYMETIKQQVKI